MVLSTVHDTTIFSIGDLIRVHQKIQEDQKIRTQVFEGTVISISGSGVNKSITVRRLGSGNIGVERIFQIASPLIEKIEVHAKGNVRRSKLYYLRDKSSREVANVTKKN